MTDHPTIERLARRLCADASGSGSKRRGYWMRKAQRLAKRVEAMPTWQGLAAVFGRVK